MQPRRRIGSADEHDRADDLRSHHAHYDRDVNDHNLDDCSAIAHDDSLADVEKQVIAGFEAGEKAYLAALADPANFDPATIKATYAVGSVRDNVISSISDFQRQGFRTKPGPQGLQYYVVEDVKLLDGPPVAHAQLSVCSVSDSVIYDPRDPGNPDDDAIVNAELVSRRRQWMMVFEDGTWKRATNMETEKKVAENACPAKPSS